MRITIRILLIISLFCIPLIAGCRSKEAGPVLKPVDVTPPALNFTPFHVCINGKYAYIASKVNGVHILDITDPLNPVWVNCIKTPGRAYDVRVSGKYAYIADGAAGLHILDVESPKDAKIVQTIDTPGIAYGVAVRSGYAYVADGLSGMQVVDIDPMDMAYIVGNVPTESEALTVKLSGNDAYIGCGQGLVIADITKPEKATQINVNKVAESYGEFDLRGDYAYYAHRDGLDIIFTKKPQWAYVKSNIEPWVDEKEDQKREFLGLGWYGLKETEQREEYEKMGWVKTFTSVAVFGDYAITGGYNQMLHIINIANPLKPYLIDRVLTPSPAASVTVSGKYAWVAEPEVGLIIVNISNPRSAYIAKTIASPNPADIEVAGGYAYLAAGSLGLQIIDVDPPESASLVKSLDTKGAIKDVLYSNGYIYAVDVESGLQIISVPTPEEAKLVKTVKLEGFPWWVGIEGDYAYVVSRAAGVYVIDITPPEDASVTFFIELPDMIFNVAGAVSGDFLYAIGCKKPIMMAQVEEVSSSILNIFNIHDPKNPWVTNTVGIDLRAVNMTVSGKYLYASDAQRSLRIVDVDPPELSKVVKTVKAQHSITSNVVHEGGYVYAGTAGGMLVINVEPVAFAKITTTVPTDSTVGAIALAGDYAYVCDRDGGFRIIKLWEQPVSQ